MQKFLKNLEGDLAIWGIVALLALFSFLPVYSASSNLVYVIGTGTTIEHFIKHVVLLIMGFGIIYGIHRIPTHYFKGLSLVALPIVIVLLLYTLSRGTMIEGANASRWISVPFIGSFQPSSIAAVVLMIYVARYLAKFKDVNITLKQSIVPLWLPVFVVIILILPANFSTAAILFSMVLLLTFIGGYPLKNIFIIRSKAKDWTRKRLIM